MDYKLLIKTKYKFKIVPKVLSPKTVQSKMVVQKYVSNIQNVR